jgi:hypothetical protein
MATKILEPEDARGEARRARHAGRLDEEQFYLGYATGLIEAYVGARRDPHMRIDRTVFAHGFNLAYDTIEKRGEVGSRALGHAGRLPRTPLFANVKRSSRKSRRKSRPKAATRRRSR